MLPQLWIRIGVHRFFYKKSNGEVQNALIQSGNYIARARKVKSNEVQFEFNFASQPGANVMELYLATDSKFYYEGKVFKKGTFKIIIYFSLQSLVNINNNK